MSAANDKPNTHDDLKEAFAGESQAFQKYTSFAEIADKEGRPNIARLFRTTAQAERIHAAGHFASLDGTAGTVENLRAAIAGETFEFETMYPPMLTQAEAEGHRAARMFRFAVLAEKVHAELYARALAAAARGEDLTEEKFYLCPVCGHIEFGTPPDKCPICGVAAGRFVLV
jgi:rubrerythrin